jgi:hypothetical protein
MIAIAPLQDRDLLVMCSTDKISGLIIGNDCPTDQCHRLRAARQRPCLNDRTDAVKSAAKRSAVCRMSSCSVRCGRIKNSLDQWRFHCTHDRTRKETLWSQRRDAKAVSRWDGEMGCRWKTPQAWRHKRQPQPIMPDRMCLSNCVRHATLRSASRSRPRRPDATPRSRTPSYHVRPPQNRHQRSAGNGGQTQLIFW